MAPSIIFSLLSLLLVPTSGYVQPPEEGFISGVISDKGLDYAKELLIEKGIASIVMLQLPEIENSAQVPFVGNAKVVLSDITIKDVLVNSSSVKTGESGVVVAVSGATANLSIRWRYSVSSWLIPIGISDSGNASVEVTGMQVGLTVNLRNQEGSLKLTLLDYGCYVGDLSIKLDGGASWLYQLLVDAFEGNIASAVEEAISEKIREGIENIDNLLQSIPKQISLDKTSALNVSFVGNPVLSNSSIAIAINGLFTGKNEASVLQGYQKGLKISSACGGLPKMIKLSIHENVFKSASLVYYYAGKMQLIIDELPDQAILNTAEWRFIVPQLYKRYPNDDMQLNISVSATPFIQVTYQHVAATIFVDITINVLEDGEVIPVACISVEISALCSVEIVGNNISGRLKLQNFSTYLKWSKIGKLHMNLIQSLMSSVLKTVILPYLNFKLNRGFPLPIIDGFGFQNANILYTQPWIAVCSDVFLEDYYYLGQHSAYAS
ncbi:putative BPI/LBP family protein At1g04970 [Cajanus cajan]|uniref:BPI/LBP family protein At3g20270 family n=1 Tax=Cajanus cajan TaxID=3821 RepID=A0A151SBP7_CAJCA|nr:putative BPI/LBP family protein At1g04970 [Cajanus cajan]KYP52159.1 Putative BPI/LBP family protein At3g20270 family [Cajanus cajan]